MEGPVNIPESFESFKNIIAERYAAEGLSESLKAEIENWIKIRYAETGVYGSTAGQRISFQIEMAQIFGATEQYDESWKALYEAEDYAYEMGEADFLRKIEELRNEIHGKKDEEELP